ncbi:DUF4426 domain-containing protein [Pseudoalteromonas sp.]|uniref:DUF4426 domain-containing protein n=1 Tax=Pseudoalteromonas sp. TaxID=53249 RepID=UPI00272CF0AE|nr:DUF4426 domain-containing protein [Pseudoalteromonas sp.]
MKQIILFTLLALSLFTTAAKAEQQAGAQYKILGPFEVHYIAFPSTFIQPDIAKNYDLVRSPSKGIINISVLKNSDKSAQTATLTGMARNLLGNSKQLEFKEVVEGDAIYYLAQIDYSNEEIYRFNIEINKNGKVQTLTFQQKFYVD